MGSVDTILVLATGLFLRLALPIGLTIFVFGAAPPDARCSWCRADAGQPLEPEKCWEIELPA
jgi:hypothetical protein